MTYRRVRLLGILLISAAGATSSSAQSLDQAKTFVRGIYAQYKSEHAPDITGKSAAAIFSPPLLQLIRRDVNRTRPGYVGALDFDPLCSCQDAEGIRVIALDVQTTSPVSAMAVVTLHFPEPQEFRVRLSLNWYPQGWRIDDVSTKDVASLKKLLTTGKS
jgi:hypothetical protein